MKFILSRVDDYRSHSKKWIVGRAFLFWLITRVIAVILMGVCIAVYANNGITQDSFPVFGGTPKAYKTLSALVYGLVVMGFIAPFVEEMVFRLGLSFKKWQVALGLAFIPVFVAWYDIKDISVLKGVICALSAGAVYYLVFRFTTQEFWSKIKARSLVSATWITSIAFGLIHLLAFSYYSWEMLPYMFCTILIPFFAGCACAYLRVNLGFRWGLAMHIFNNLPGIFTMLALYFGK